MGDITATQAESAGLNNHSYKLLSAIGNSRLPEMITDLIVAGMVVIASQSEGIAYRFWENGSINVIIQILY